MAEQRVGLYKKEEKRVETVSRKQEHIEPETSSYMNSDLTDRESYPVYDDDEKSRHRTPSSGAKIKLIFTFIAYMLVFLILPNFLAWWGILPKVLMYVIECAATLLLVVLYLKGGRNPFSDDI